jgi:hypothetical protein
MELWKRYLLATVIVTVAGFGYINGWDREIKSDFRDAVADEPAAAPEASKSVDAKWADAVKKEFTKKFKAGQLDALPTVAENEVFGLPVGIQKKYHEEISQTDNGVSVYKMNVKGETAYLVANDGDEAMEVWAYNEAGALAKHFKCSADKTGSAAAAKMTA